MHKHFYRTICWAMTEPGRAPWVRWVLMQARLQVQRRMSGKEAEEAAKKGSADARRTSNTAAARPADGNTRRSSATSGTRRPSG